MSDAPPPPAAASRFRRALAGLLAAVLVGVSAWATLFWLGLPDRLPSDADYRAANERIAQASGGAAGEARIVLAPDWATRGRDFLTALPVDPAYDLAEEPFLGVDRVWLVALADAPRFDLEAARATLRARATGAHDGARIGGLWVERFELDSPKVLYSFTDSVASATVVGEGPVPQPCPWKASTRRHQCRQEWEHVRAATHEIGERPLRCLYAHPLSSRTLALTFRNVPAGRAIEGRAGFVGQAPAKGDGPVTLAVEAGGRALGSETFPNGFALRKFALPLPPSEGTPVDVTFRVTSPRPDWRHFCFDAAVVADGPASTGLVP